MKHWSEHFLFDFMLCSFLTFHLSPEADWAVVEPSDPKPTWKTSSNVSKNRKWKRRKCTLWQSFLQSCLQRRKEIENSLTTMVSYWILLRSMRKESFSTRGQRLKRRSSRKSICCIQSSLDKSVSFWKGKALQIVSSIIISARRLRITSNLSEG